MILLYSICNDRPHCADDWIGTQEVLQMDFKIFGLNLAVPALAMLVIGALTGCFGIKKKESVKGELFEYFKKLWNTDEKASADGKQSFFSRFFDLFVQTYEYEEYKENANKLKYYFYKVVVMCVILSIPFLALFLITRKEWILNNSEWNDIYLYTVILVPLIFSYLINKYCRIRQYYEIWHRHMRNRHLLEWRMLVFIKDYELPKSAKSSSVTARSAETLKIEFINDVCGFWKSATDAIPAEAKEENIFDDIGSLFGKD